MNNEYQKRQTVLSFINEIAFEHGEYARLKAVRDGLESEFGIEQDDIIKILIANYFITEEFIDGLGFVYHVTGNGKQFLRDGGYSTLENKERKESINYWSVLISSVTAIIGVAFGIWMGILNYQSTHDVDDLKSEINANKLLIESFHNLINSSTQ